MEQLPEEILFQIFDLLTGRDVKSLSKVCQRFEQFIYTSSSLMSKFTIAINLAELNDIRNHRMPYNKLEITQPPHYNHFPFHDFSIINKIIRLENVEDLKLITPSVTMASDLLDNFKNLKKLTITKIQRKLLGGDDEEVSVSLPKLKYLNVQDVGSYLKCIKNHQVEELIVTDSNEEQSRVSRALNTFLRNANNLKKFSLYGRAPTFEVEKFKFKLEKFCFSNMAVYNDDDIMKIPPIELLKSQKDHIKELQLFGLVSKEMLTFAFAEMKQLEKLEIQMQKIFFLPQLSTCKSLKYLDFFDLPNSIETLPLIINCCPNLETLKIQSKFNENSIHFMEVLPKSLKHLKLHSINSEVTAIVCLESLEILHILEVTTDAHMKNLAKLLKSCKNLKKLKINNWKCRNVAKSVVIALVNAAEIIEINKDFLFNDDHLDTLLFEYESRLKIIKMNTEYSEKIEQCIDALNAKQIQLIMPSLIQHRMEEDDEDETDIESDDEVDSNDESEHYYESNDENSDEIEDSDDEADENTSDNDESDDNDDSECEDNENDTENGDETLINFNNDNEEELLVEIYPKKRQHQDENSINDENCSHKRRKFD